MAQVGVKDKRILQFLVLFTAFYIFTNPDTAGMQARLFFDWILELADSAVTFISALFEGDPSVATTTTTTATPVDS
ncbi:MAG: hypothetical protein GY724_25530 [Actinomycetia bacterium]|nr:hypothetical protein [Actinomycetes bacterium]MCP4227510.1 hypothetical protein [Actinomycetes bacterium]MCP5031357.1 hypothetical protein [Actinomycetes bacterium]